MSDPNKMICGMTPTTAERYLVIRQEIDIMIQRIHKAGYWLSEFDKAQPEGLRHTLSMMGVMIVHSISTIHDYLENEFASLDTVRQALKDNRP
ncbi:MAG: hypothetical protein PVH87_24980 [Desulfobacteraceae bacterium]|jgi:hypothetical protein